MPIIKPLKKTCDLKTAIIEKEWIPRFKRDRLQGEANEAITLDKRIVNKIIRVEVNGTVVANDNFQVDKTTGVLFRVDGSIFPYPTRTKPFNVVVDYEYGHDYIKNGVDRIGLKLLIDRIVSSNISDRTRSYQDEIARKELGYGKEGERLYRFPKEKIYEKNKGVQNK